MIFICVHLRNQTFSTLTPLSTGRDSLRNECGAPMLFLWRNLNARYAAALDGKLLSAYRKKKT
jgi:hypothetical protein